MVPVAGFLATYLLVAGISLSNVDIRGQAEIVGLLVLAFWPALGLLLTQRAARPPLGLTVNIALALLVVALAGIAYVSKRPFKLHAPRAANELAIPLSRPLRVWIDTDLACGSGKTADVDDCWALALALRSPELDVAGISTVFGNRLEGGARDATRRTNLARAILTLARRDVGVFSGNETEGRDDWPATSASEAMAIALKRSRLTIVAIGPASNVATVLTQTPRLAHNIERIVMVAGQPPGRLFHPGRHWWFHFSDFNVSEDVAAMQAVLASGVPITLVPFDLAAQLTITEADFERLRGGSRLARWLVETSAGWMAFWQGGLIKKQGFNPFDALAVGYAALPGLFDCEEMHARIGFSVFLAAFGLGHDLEVVHENAGAPVRYCRTVDPRFKSMMLERLQAAP